MYDTEYGFLVHIVVPHIFTAEKKPISAECALPVFLSAKCPRLLKMCHVKLLLKMCHVKNTLLCTLLHPYFSAVAKFKVCTL